MSAINNQIWEILNEMDFKDPELEELIKKILVLELENEDRSGFDAVKLIKELLEDSEGSND